MFYKDNIPWNKGKHLTEEDRHKKSLAALGEKNHEWKGYDTKLHITALHQWVRRNLPQPDICPCCEEKPTLDLANYTGVYTRDFDNWVYLCRTCHMKLDYRTGDRK